MALILKPRHLKIIDFLHKRARSIVFCKPGYARSGHYRFIYCKNHRACDGLIQQATGVQRDSAYHDLVKAGLINWGKDSRNLTQGYPSGYGLTDTGRAIALQRTSECEQRKNTRNSKTKTSSTGRRANRAKALV